MPAAQVETLQQRIQQLTSENARLAAGGAAQDLEAKKKELEAKIAAEESERDAADSWLLDSYQVRSLCFSRCNPIGLHPGHPVVR